MRIIFMGTPDFAVASLDALVQSGENIVAVITAPDKPAGRGQKLHQSAVKVYAEAHNIPVLQPVKLKDADFLEELRSYQADLQVVVAFRMLPEAVWKMPPYGTINVHASLLPQYRGAAPINHAIINGEEVTGVSTFLLQHEIDTGSILLSKEVTIAPDDNAGILHDKLMHTGAEILLKTIAGLKNNTLTPKAQSNLLAESELKHAPKIFKENCQIDWKKDVDSIYNLIRGLSPYPAAFTSLDNKVLKLYTVSKEYATPDIAQGDYKTDGKTYLKFAGNNGYISVKQLQIEGKKKMEIIDFLRGYRF
ncbi:MULTISPECIES: methionyl-tRNA formyltransferase [Sphingobacterium]|uniref:Methionyl-tRNA formyltransferase n=1 Tax=Sphingobacterium anhuiense TaxID=493780 RepID=A0ABW5YQG4_9SPHI|nr:MULTISPECIES: methionyl-tRNA formyltransferase [unclassified Sphingobacterium]MCS3557107.1 methionyl-tRNA formyltransferase [Sphingobacterium sp. JUb21]TCQ98150.1 methionyl-tRNA formyltransferase [Sphingobacterium sp. JUb20]